MTASLTSDAPDFVADESLHTIRSAVNELCEERGRFETFVNELLDELEQIRVQLVDRESQLDGDRQALAEREDEIAVVGP